MKILGRRSSSEKKEYCLIGLNKFNLEVGKFLMNDGHKVTVLDFDSKRINNYGDRFSYAVVCDVTNIKELATVGMDSFDYVVVGITDIGTSVIAVTNLRELGVNENNILCKAKDDSHKRILKFLKITTSYIPEEEVASKVSYKLIHGLNVDVFSISQENKDTLFMQIPLENEDLYGKMIKDVEFIKNLSSIVISLKRSNGTIVTPVGGKDVLQQGDTICIICKKKDLTTIKDNLS